MDKKEDVREFEKLEQQVHAFLDEISELSRKKPDGPLNEFKLKFINSTLLALNNLLGEHRPFADFGQFDLDDLPTNSDVVVILSQYAAATYNFRKSNTQRVSDYSNEWTWLIKGRASDLKTRSPELLKYGAK
ncbi:MAG: hypothetical protein WBC78_05835 [Candidatus Sulfotelmatobacter sp.]